MTKTRKINLALQGGGSHGAYSWGVLDRLLEDGRLEIEAVSGASAGSMNAVALAQGLAAGGRDGARETLAAFWRKVGEQALFSPIQRNWFDRLTGNWSLDRSPGYIAMDLWSRLVSPYDVNIANWNPLRDVLCGLIDFDKIRRSKGPDLFISATDVKTGRGRVFTRKELTPEMVLASAALPNLYKAVEVNGSYYWDGGFAGNPPLYPFYDSTDCKDILIVQITPIIRDGVPESAREIEDRLNEITFNSTLVSELRAIDFVRRLIRSGRLQDADYREILMHIIFADDALTPLGASSKQNAEPAFLKHLFDIGRVAADSWLERSFEHIGVRSSLDIRAVLGMAERTEALK